MDKYYKRQSEIKADFDKETANHVMTIIKDDGLHRHLRFGQDDGGFAAMHMSGYIREKLSTMTLPERAEFWKDYVRKEVSFLYIGEEFEE
ncbi:hypothetical protein [Vibrio fluvialis]|uniref:hypothetical protein n=1 Tax=Vibrio fluvialis TaxID=676 RepID=UPI003D0B8E37